MPTDPNQLTQTKKDTFILDHWRQRRMMSYISIAWVILQTFLWIAIEILAPGTIMQLGAVVGWSYSLASVPIVGYFANTAIDTFKNPENNRNPTRVPRTPEPPTPGNGPWVDGI